MMKLPSILPMTIAVLFAGVLLPPVPPATAESPISFEQEVMPILRRSCTTCHQPGGEGYEASGLDLRSYDGLMKGTKYGPIVVPGDPFVSNLMVLLEGRASPAISMPYHGEPLRRSYLSIIRHWIEEGAKAD